MKYDLPGKTDIVDNSQYVLQAWDKYAHHRSQFKITRLHDRVIHQYCQQTPFNL